MLATIKQNKIGHLHVWFGDVNINEVSKYNFLSNGKESDLYIFFLMVKKVIYIYKAKKILNVF